MNTTKQLLSVLALMICVLFAMGSLDLCSTEENEAIVSGEKPSVKVTAEQIFVDYDENEIAADDKYKEKIIQISGKVLSISGGIIGDYSDPYITLDSNKMLGNVNCSFDSSHKSDLAKLKKGETTTVKCIGTGKMGYVVFMKNCMLVSQ